MKEQKKHKHFSLALHLTVFVFGIMTISGAIVSLVSYASYKLGFFASFFSSPVYLVLCLLLISTAVGTVLAAVFGRISVRHFDKLIAGLSEVKEGNYAARMPRSRMVNLDRVAQNFNSMAEQLSGIETLRNDFVADFSHEFKTPIVSIRGFAKLLKSGAVDKAQQQEYLDIIFSEADRLSTMAENTLLLTRLQTQGALAEKKRYALDEQLRRCVLLLENEWTKKELKLSIDLPEVFIAADEDLLSQLWINLLSNAVKFTPKGGEITVSTALSAEGGVTVKIADTGCGMDEQTLSHLFDKFYQGDPSHRCPGNGLGLAIVKRVVALSGGTISVSSQQGKGSEFIVELPG